MNYRWIDLPAGRILMLEALLRGKLSRTQENLEDILTSNVFGLLKYLPPEEGLLPFLSLATMVDGSRPLEISPLGAEVEYRFWPSYSEPGCNGCEPDVELRLLWSDGTKTLVFIECKYFSGKSSEEEGDQSVVGTKPEPPTDQLAREWSNLVRLARREGAKPLLIYLTRDVGIPRKELEDSHRAAKKGASQSAFSCAWLSWHHLHEIRSGMRSPIMVDLRALLERLNLVFFHGFSAFPRIPNTEWRFSSPKGTGKFDGKMRHPHGGPYAFAFLKIPRFGWRIAS